MTNIIATLPKVDLYRDFCSSISPGILREKLGKRADKLTAWRSFDSVAGFSSACDKIRGILAEGSDYEQAAVGVLEELVERSIVHSEFHLDPLAKKVPIEVQVARIDVGHELVTEEQEDALVSYGYILELDRTADTAAQKDAISRALEATTKVLAVAFVGKEQALSSEQIALADWCRNRGLRIVIAAGLEPGAKGIQDAVELRADRVLHGFGVLKKADSLVQLRARRTPIVSVASIEVKAGRAKSFARHPIQKMLDAGLFCTFASGAPSAFGGSLTGEFELLSTHLGWRLDALRNSTLRAIEAGFIEPRLRFVVARAVENWRHRPRLTAGGDEEGYGL